MRSLGGAEVNLIGGSLPTERSRNPQLWACWDARGTAGSIMIEADTCRYIYSCGYVRPTTVPAT